MPSKLRRSRALIVVLSVLAMAATISACTETQIVEVPRPPFNPAPDSVAGFLGLYDVATNQTTCGNCHINNQSVWSKTKHANAYHGLVDNVPNAPQTCFACHTVNQRGNIYASAGQPGGWEKVADPVYHNVQCESCHGPGLTHVTNPDATNIPLASALVTPSEQTCVACHNGAHHPFAEQWSQSAHSNLRADTPSDPANQASCVGCHSGADALARLSGNAPSNYIGKNTKFPITCAVCHDPHAKTNEGQLRAPIDNPDVTINLCSSCHTRSALATPSFTINSRGAHAAQGAIYFGEGAGWIPPGFVFDPNNPVQTSHQLSNPRLCAGCHVVSFTTTDASTGEEFTSVGHLFSPNPCKDASGIPVGGDCAYTPSTTRFWTGCAAAGCHASEAVAANQFNGTRAQVQALLDILWIDSNHNTVLETTDGGLLAQVLALNPSTTVPGTDSAYYCCTGATKDNSLSVAEGALFNARMLAEDLYSHNDGSKGIHNPPLYKGLIAGSISAVRARYGLTTVLSPSDEALIQKALSAPGVRYSAPAALRQTANR